MTITDAERDYYRSVLSTIRVGVDKMSVQDLRYAYFLAALNGELPSGTSLPPGGAFGDVLTKKSASDGDVKWAAPTGGGSAYELRGTGFPEGVVTAPAGTYYTDTTGTSGAIRWVKTAGTGNTGWAVLFGDTGWRNVTSLLATWPTGFSGNFYQRRIAERVYLAMNLDLSGVASGFSDFSVSGVPSGFLGKAEPGAAYPHTIAPIVRADSGISASLRLSWSGSNLRFQGMGQAASYVLPLSTSYLTSDPWPNTLPGTSA